MDAFANYATRTAFSVALTNPQIQCLLNLHYDRLDYLDSGHFLVTLAALTRRGLVVAVPSTRTCVSGGEVKTVVIFTHRTTEAGKAMVPLLELAGFSLTKHDTSEVSNG